MRFSHDSLVVEIDILITSKEGWLSEAVKLPVAISPSFNIGRKPVKEGQAEYSIMNGDVKLISLTANAMVAKL